MNMVSHDNVIEEVKPKKRKKNTERGEKEMRKEVSLIDKYMFSYQD